MVANIIFHGVIAIAIHEFNHLYRTNSRRLNIVGAPRTGKTAWPHVADVLKYDMCDFATEQGGSAH